MGLIALLFAHHGAADTAGEPYGALDVAGISIIERQIRQARAVGATRILVLAERMPPRLAAALDKARDGEVPVEILRTAAAVGPCIAVEDRVLVLEEGLVIDERVIDAVLAVPGVPVLGTWASTSEIGEAERIDATTLWAGISVYSGRLVRGVAETIGEWDLQSTLLRAAAADSMTTRLDLASLDTYALARRRHVPLVWVKVRSGAEARRATGKLLAAAQKGCLDWPARYIHPPVEDALVRLLLPTHVTPNMVTVLCGAVGLLAAYAFANGWLWFGLILALITGPLDGVDGKLARTRLEFSRWGDLEHVLDKIVEYLWYICLAYWFSSQSGNGTAWALAALIILFALAEAIQGEFFRRFAGVQLDDAGEFERRFRLISGRRNTFFWTYVPFALFGAWEMGFAMIAGYSIINFFVMQARFLYRLQLFGRAQSPVIEANFRRTTYGFLSSEDGSGS